MTTFGKASTARKEVPPRQVRRKAPHPIDVHAGKRLRELRILRGLSQMALAAKVGITFQQVQKYESGSNRLTASRMGEIARALDAHPAYFFEHEGAFGATGAVLDRGTRRWIGLFQALPDQQAKDRLLEMVKQAVRLTRPRRPESP